MTAQRRRIAPPRELSASARRLFANLTGEYRIDDLGGREILRSGLRALDLAEAAERQIEAEGRTLRDRFEQVRAHPLLGIARDYRAQWAAALRQLNLAVGEPPKVGRPGEAL